MRFLNYFTRYKHFKKAIILVFFGMSAIVWFGFWTYKHYVISTDNAYVNANIVQISPRITGKIVNLYVTNNQYVKKDQPLLDIDPEPFQLAINSAQAQLTLSNAELDNAVLVKDRILSLVAKKFESAQDGDNAIAKYKTAAAKVQQAKAMLDQANLNLAYTKILSPSSGWVTNVTATVGEIIPANQPLFALISDDKFWVDANFRETELESIKPGQTAIVVTDLYPGHPFHGRVESISGGTGAAFSLLPPQNATGNWVKITQRIPVRVHVLNPDPHFPLRIGISANVTIKLHDMPQIDQS